MRPTLYIFALILLISVQVYGQGLPSAVINAMSSRTTRYHHFIWHQIRNLWNRFDSDTQNAIRRLGWAPPRPAQRFTSGGTAVVISDNRAGEDFLYMHRQMIGRVNSLSSFRVNGWDSIPEPGDNDFPVPSSYSTPESQTNDLIRRVKTSSYYYNTLRPLENRFKDPDYLRSISLGRLGSELEFRIHNFLHVRWSASSRVGYRPRPSNDPLPDVSSRWDSPSYTWLVDNYASHVNPLFWRLHGWVDDRIEDWRRANGLSSISWRGTWTGGSLSRLGDLIDAGQDAGFRNLGEGDGMCEDHDNIEVLEEVVAIIRKTGLEFGPCDPVVFEEDLTEEERQSLKGSKYEGDHDENDVDEPPQKRNLRQDTQN